MAQLGFFHCSDKLLKAAEALDLSEKENISIKSVIYSNDFKKGLKEHSRQFKSLLGTVFKVLEHQSVCDELIEKGDLRTVNGREWPSRNLARVLVFTLMWGKDSDLGTDAGVLQVLRHNKDKLRQLLVHCTDKLPRGASSNVKHFKFVRVNTLLSTVSEVISALKTHGMKQIPTPDSLDSYYGCAKGLKEFEFLVDFHFSCLLAVISFKKIRLVAQDLFTSGVLIIQDKASLLPTTLLNPSKNSTVLDMCAAPGMKTSHLAALMQNTGKIYAVDRNPVRFKSLQTLSKKYGLKKNIRPILGDILETKCIPMDSIEYILLDAPCSGSGMIGRPGENNYTKDRLGKLKTLQRKMLKFALSRFKRAKKVVYSTCSIFPEENEEVVDDVHRLAQVHGFQPVDCHKVLHGFPPGNGSSRTAPFCISCKPQETLTKGFFVAMFERSSHAEFNSEIQDVRSNELNGKKRTFSACDEETEHFKSQSGYFEQTFSGLKEYEALNTKNRASKSPLDSALSRGVGQHEVIRSSYKNGSPKIKSKKTKQICASNGILWEVTNS